MQRQTYFRPGLILDLLLFAPHTPARREAARNAVADEQITNAPEMIVSRRAAERSPGRPPADSFEPVEMRSIIPKAVDRPDTAPDLAAAKPGQFLLYNPR